MKYFVYIVLFLSFLNANNLDDKIENLIGANNFVKHRNLISNLTVNKNLFHLGEDLKYSKILDMLNQNGLLKLRFDSPKKVEITLIVKNKPMKAMKILKDTLVNLGYSYYFTDSLTYKDNVLIWKINFKSEYMLDPYIFNKDLNKNEAQIVNINRISETNWEYELDMQNAKLENTLKVEKNERIRLKKPLKAYLIKVNDAKQLSVASKKYNHWYPKISFFDKDLKVLGVIKKYTMYKGLKINIPFDTYYIKIEDNYTLLNIKRGLTIVLR